MEKEVSYNVEVSSHYSEWTIGNSNLEDFSFDEFVNNSDFKVKNFDLLVIKKFVKYDGGVKIKPIFLIYNRYIWEPKYNLVKNNADQHYKTTVESNHHSLTFQGRVKTIACSDQESMIRAYKLVSGLLLTKDKIKIKKKVKN